MIGYIARRLLQAIPVLIVSSILVFLLLHLSPGDPVLNVLGIDADEEQIESMREQMGLDQPVTIQYLRWISSVVRGDLGRSFVSRRAVTELLGPRVLATAELATAAIVITVLASMGLGIAAALRANRPLDWIINGGAAIAIASPYFWIGVLAIMFFAVTLHWLPPGGRVPFTQNPAQALRFLILPASVMAIRQAAILTRFVRSSVVEVLGRNYVRTAHAKGISPLRVLSRHIVRNALIPIVTMVGIRFGRLLAGAVIVESVFAWPGMGRMLVQGVLNRDYPVVQGVLLVMVLIFVLVNLVTDLLYAAIDPRIRLGSGRK